MTQIIQQLKVYLRGGQTMTINFNAQKAEVLNTQIDDFLKTMGDKEKAQGLYLFQGAQVALIRLADVSACDVVSLIAKEPEKKEASAK